MARRVRIIVTANDEYFERMSELEAKLRGAGARIEDSFEATGQIQASIDAEDLELARELPGVLGIEIEGELTLPPPDAEIQ